MLLIDVALVMIFGRVFGLNAMITIFKGGYGSLDTEMGQIVIDLAVITIIPALYLATKIVRDRPFSSYASSRGGWNFKLYLKALVIPLILFLIFLIIQTSIQGPEGTCHFSLAFLIISLIFIPLQCIAEEYVFRGLIMQTFGSWFAISVLALALQAIIFALGHSYNSLGILEMFILGIILGYFAWKTNGIEVSSAIHTANNLSLALFVMFGLQSSTSSPTVFDKVSSIVFLIILGAVMHYVANKTDLAL